MGPNTKPFSQADRSRIDSLQELGCIVTIIYFRYWKTPGDIHHLLENGRRYEDEHQYTICLRPWYHRGIPPINRHGHSTTRREAEKLLGPSMYFDMPEFERRFGTELDLLEMTNALMSRIRPAIGALSSA